MVLCWFFFMIFPFILLFSFDHVLAFFWYRRTPSKLGRQIYDLTASDAYR